ncbi:hypothetical protein CLSAB_19340 [Clostridium saccharobutylicum]|nr:hypothetical protein CLSAB_19340 [Clostridium saccharobutylicum]
MYERNALGGGHGVAPISLNITYIWNRLLKVKDVKEK